MCQDAICFTCQSLNVVEVSLYLTLAGFVSMNVCSARAQSPDFAATIVSVQLQVLCSGLANSAPSVQGPFNDSCVLIFVQWYRMQSIVQPSSCL